LSGQHQHMHESIIHPRPLWDDTSIAERGSEDGLDVRLTRGEGEARQGLKKQKKKKKKKEQRKS
jgi:hypothetical protein